MLCHIQVKESLLNSAAVRGTIDTTTDSDCDEPSESNIALYPEVSQMKHEVTMKRYSYIAKCINWGALGACVTPPPPIIFIQTSVFTFPEASLCSPIHTTMCNHHLTNQ